MEGSQVLDGELDAKALNEPSKEVGGAVGERSMQFQKNSYDHARSI